MTAAAELVLACYDNDLKRVTQRLKSATNVRDHINDKVPDDQYDAEVKVKPLASYITALNVASKCSNYTITNLLLKTGATLDVPDSEGRLAIHWACLSDIDGLTKVQTFAHMDEKCINARDNNHKTPLMLACCAGKNDIVMFLLSNGADANAEDKIGWSALHQAAYNNQLQIIKTLLNGDADPNKQDLKGNTALHCAAEEAKLDSIKAITSFLSCDLSICNKNDQTALDVAKAKPDEQRQDEYDAIIAYLSEFDSSPTQLVMAHVTLLQDKYECLKQEAGVINSELQQRCNALEKQVLEMEEKIRELEMFKQTTEEKMANGDMVDVNDVEFIETTPVENGNALKLSRDQQWQAAQVHQPGKVEAKNKRIAEAILKQAMNIIEEVKCDDHLYFLYDRKVINFSQLQDVKVESTDRKKMEKLIHILLSKTNNYWAPLFLETLKSTPSCSQIVQKIMEIS